jgi:hypothetical protein
MAGFQGYTPDFSQLKLFDPLETEKMRRARGEADLVLAQLSQFRRMSDPLYARAVAEASQSGFESNRAGSLASIARSQDTIQAETQQAQIQKERWSALGEAQRLANQGFLGDKYASEARVAQGSEAPLISTAKSNATKAGFQASEAGSKASEADTNDLIRTLTATSDIEKVKAQRDRAIADNMKSQADAITADASIDPIISRRVSEASKASSDAVLAGTNAETAAKAQADRLAAIRDEAALKAQALRQRVAIEPDAVKKAQYEREAAQYEADAGKLNLVVKQAKAPFEIESAKQTVENKELQGTAIEALTTNRNLTGAKIQQAITTNGKLDAVKLQQASARLDKYVVDAATAKEKLAATQAKDSLNIQILTQRTKEATGVSLGEKQAKNLIDITDKLVADSKDLPADKAAEFVTSRLRSIQGSQTSAGKAFIDNIIQTVPNQIGSAQAAVARTAKGAIVKNPIVVYDSDGRPARLGILNGRTINVDTGEQADTSKYFTQNEASKNYDRKYGADQAKLHTELEQEGSKAADTLRNIKALKQLAQTADFSYTGKVSSVATKLLAPFGDFAVDSTSSREAMYMIANKMVLDNASQMKGSLSDKDVVFLNRTIASPDMTEAGFHKVIELLEKQAVNKQMLGIAVSRIRGAGYPTTIARRMVDKVVQKIKAGEPISEADF